MDLMKGIVEEILQEELGQVPGWKLRATRESEWSGSA
jgi:hypothetical protein